MTARTSSLLHWTAYVMIAALIAAALLGLYFLGEARADAGLPPDAGPGLVLDAAPGAGSAVATAPAAPVLADPISDPGKAFDDLRAARKLGWSVFAFALLVMLSRLAGRAGAEVRALAWLGRGKVAIIVGAVGAMSLAVYNALALGGTLMAAASAAVVAIAYALNPTPAPAPKA